MSTRFAIILRALLLTGLASLLVAMHPHHKFAPRAAPSASIAPDEQKSQPASPAAAMGSSEGAAAIVNDTVISNYDVKQRMALFIATSGIRPTPEAIKQIRDEVLRSLVDETLQLQEALKNKVAISDVDVSKAMENIAKQNNITTAQIKEMLQKANVDVGTLQKQIITGLAWNKLVQQELSSRVQITEKDIDAQLQRLTESSHKPQFLVSEIFVAINSPTQEDKARNGANQIVQQLNMGAPFAAVARQFSQSPSAAAGGDIGWVEQGQLTEVLDQALSGMHPGKIAGPFRALGGFYILLLRERREPAGTVVPKTAAIQSGPLTEPVPLARLLLPLPPKSSKDIEQRALQISQTIREHINGCANLGALAKQIRGAVYMNLGTMRPADLSPDLRNALANTQSGDVAQPFISAAGVEIIVRCDPKVERIEAFQMPSRKEVGDQLYADQMSMMARRYLRDLKRDAVVEYR